jgi:hypothetical protein
MENYMNPQSSIAFACRDRSDAVTSVLTEMRHVGSDLRAVKGEVRLLPTGKAIPQTRFRPVTGTVQPGIPPV